MKTLRYSYTCLLSLAMLLAGCNKQESKVYYTGSTPPALTASSTSLTLAAGQETNTAVTFRWTNPNYQFTTGSSSQNVSYTLEMDTAGGTFNTARRYTTSISNDLSFSLTVGDINNILGNTIKVDTSGRRSTVQARITASINGAIPVVSNVLQFSTNAFSPPPKVALPTSGNLYIVGNATVGGWNNPVPTPSQQFTKRAGTSTIYEITLPLIANNSYLLLPINGDWGDKYGGVGAANNSNNPDADGFKRGGSDLKAPAASGTYKIVLNFQDGTYTLTKL